VSDQDPRPDEAVEVEYAIRRASGTIEHVASRVLGERLVKNDPERVLLRRTVTPWEPVEPEDTP
jgi:hypothetical protein